MLKLMSKTMDKKVDEGRGTRDFKAILDKVLVGRAWEVLEAAERQFPEAARQVKAALAQLVFEDKLKEPITGEKLLKLFRSLGLSVRLQTEIRVLEGGRLKSLGEKLGSKQHF